MLHHTDTDELLLLLEAGQEINRSLRLDEVANITLNQAIQITQSDLATIFFTDENEILKQEDSASMAPSSSLTENDELFKLAQEAANSRQIIYKPQHNLSEETLENAPTHLLLPLLTHDKLVGVLALKKAHAPTFSESLIQRLPIFCDRVAMAIENAGLFEKLSNAYIDLAQSREKILDNHNTLQVILEGITDDLYIVDDTLNISILNQGSATQPEHLPLDSINSKPELLAKVKEARQTARKTTWISSEDEVQPYLKDREFRIYPIRNRLGQVDQSIIFAQDISERRQLQASLFRSANLAAIGQLAGGVAHQINNPLTVAMANSQLILMEANLTNNVKELSQDIFKSTERIQSIVRNLLEFSNQETYLFVQTDLVTTIDDALALVMHSLKKSNIAVINDYQVYPQLSASISHLKLVWMNLLLNARDAIIQQQTDHPQITISTQVVSDREVKVIVSDNGIGLVEGTNEQLFQPFFTTKLASNALGLGLYSAHNIIERHKGQINILSEPGLKTTFEVIIPLDNPRDL